MWRRIKAPWMAIFLVVLLGVEYLWIYRFEPLLSNEAGNGMFVWDRWTYRVCALTGSGEATKWRCDNAMETDSSSNDTNSDVSIRKCMRDTAWRIDP